MGNEAQSEMRLTLQLTDEQVIALNDVLRVRDEDYKPNPENDYARRLLVARRILDLPMAYPKAIIVNVIPSPSKE